MESKKLILQCKQAGCFALVSLGILLFAQSGMAQTTSDTTQAQFGGPGSVQGQIADDTRHKESLAKTGKLQDYFDWKDRLREKHGLSYSVDYTSAILGATNTLNNDNTFASGAFRFYGYWDIVGRKSGNTGSFIWKVEDRHKYTNFGANKTASEIGYVGLLLPTLSDIGLRLTNLYWKQNLIQGKMEIAAGFIDVTDWVDLYALASPWNGFFNFALATGSASMFLPDDATIGAYISAMITKHLYVSAGLSDANSISTDPFKGFETFFNDREYFTSLELGWIKSQDRFYFNNTHITLWHVDERKNAGTKEAWGINFSASHGFKLKWMYYLRGGFSTKGSGWFLQKSVSAGLGYHLKDEISLLGLGFNWSQPNEDTYGEKLENQFSTEVFCRLQVIRNFELTPNIQWVINPPLNTIANQSWVFGLRSRLFF
ncbi:MAG: carbohydrate porin [Cyclobacteriaceae bacterium]|nr:carbohydrate porin [Cyclobacteriaceae bacterium]